MIRATVTALSEAALQKIVDDAKAKIMIDIHAEAVRRTPVDEGTARKGWTVDTQAGVVENNVEHIVALNNGHSSQAPAGFVEASVDAVLNS